MKERMVRVPEIRMFGSWRTLTTNLTDLLHNFNDINELCDIEVLDFNKKPLQLVPVGSQS